MTDDERRKLSELHAFFMEPTAPGKPSRAALLDDALDAVAAGKLGGRVILWVASLVAAVGVIYTSIRGWRP